MSRQKPSGPYLQGRGRGAGGGQGRQEGGTRTAPFVPGAAWDLATLPGVQLLYHHC